MHVYKATPTLVVGYFLFIALVVSLTYQDIMSGWYAQLPPAYNICGTYKHYSIRQLS